MWSRKARTRGVERMVYADGGGSILIREVDGGGGGGGCKGLKGGEVREMRQKGHC